MRIPFRYQAGVCLLVLFCIITAPGYADPCQDEKPGQLNNNCPNISDEGQRDMGFSEHRQATSDTGFFDQKPTGTSEPGDSGPTSENEGFSHPCMSHQECREARLKDANGGEMPMNQEGQPPFRNGDTRKDPSFPGHSMGSCPMTGGFPPCPGMSGRAGGPSGPMESFLNSGDIALKSTCITSGFGFPVGLDVISQSILGIIQGSFIPGDTPLMQRPVSPVFQSDETDGTGPVSGPREMMGQGRGYNNQMPPATGDSNCPREMMETGRGCDNQIPQGTSDSNCPWEMMETGRGCNNQIPQGTSDENRPQGMMETGRGCDNQNAPGTGDSNCPWGDSFDMSNPNGGFPGPDQKLISTAGCEYPSMGGSPPLKNRESP